MLRTLLGEIRPDSGDVLLVVAVSEVLAAELQEAGQVGISILLPGLVRTNINTNAVKRPATGRAGLARRTSSQR